MESNGSFFHVHSKGQSREYWISEGRSNRVRIEARSRSLDRGPEQGMCRLGDSKMRHYQFIAPASSRITKRCPRCAAVDPRIVPFSSIRSACTQEGKLKTGRRGTLMIQVCFANRVCLKTRLYGVWTLSPLWLSALNCNSRQVRQIQHQNKFDEATVIALQPHYRFKIF